MLDALTVVAFSTQENKGGYALLPGSGLSRAGASAAGLSNYALEATPGPALANLVPDLALAKKTHTCRFERILETIVQGNESRCPKTCKYHCFADGNQTHRSTACAFFTDDVALRFVVKFSELALVSLALSPCSISVRNLRMTAATKYPESASAQPKSRAACL
jgi:hypothetical protein